MNPPEEAKYRGRAVGRNNRLSDAFIPFCYFADGLAEDLINAAVDVAVVSRDRAQLEAWELYQRALPLIYRITREDSADPTGWH